MSERQIAILTPEQEALIPVYQEKWQAIALSNEPINIQRAETAIKNAYAIMGRKTPIICFGSSPDAAISLALESAKIEFVKFLPVTRKVSFDRGNITIKTIKGMQPQISGQEKPQIKFWEELSSGLRIAALYQFKEKFYSSEVYEKILNVNWSGVGFQLYQQALLHPLNRSPTSRDYHCATPVEIFSPIQCAVTSIWLDFCSSVLHIPMEEKKWEALASVVKECGWIFCIDDICAVWDRPRICSLDSENRLHAEGKPAIQFFDNYSLYANHGVILPEKYGQVYPHEWRSQWLLEETNAELRRVLIQGIGYARICQELDATQLDAWQEYQLLTINANVDRERMHLLKMTCPSTGYIHAMRVPPNVRSARDAIKWVNWGVDPEEFSSQS